MLLERVRHQFTRLFPELRGWPYDARLEVLRLWTLEERRNRADLIEVYKMVHGLSSVPMSAFYGRPMKNRWTEKKLNKNT